MVFDILKGKLSESMISEGEIYLSRKLLAVGSNLIPVANISKVSWGQFPQTWKWIIFAIFAFITLATGIQALTSYYHSTFIPTIFSLVVCVAILFIPQKHGVTIVSNSGHSFLISTTNKNFADNLVNSFANVFSFKLSESNAYHINIQDNSLTIGDINIAYENGKIIHKSFNKK